MLLLGFRSVSTVAPQANHSICVYEIWSVLTVTIVRFYWVPYKLASVLVASGTMDSAGFITSRPGLLLILWTVWDEFMHQGICKAMDMDYIV